jgi:hypothetical protein
VKGRTKGSRGWAAFALWAALAAAATPAAAQHDDCQQPFAGGTGICGGATMDEADLPAAAGLGRIAIIRDGASATDCTTGGGSNYVLCFEQASAWTSGAPAYVAGAGISITGATIAVDSTEEGFLADLGAGGTIVCSTGLTKGAMGVSDEGVISYCPGAGTTGMSLAWGNASGAALTGDSATAFFSTGTIEDARIDGSAEADEINHDSLAGFVANEHVDHTGVSINAGGGLSGGGTIAATRTLAVDSTKEGFLADLGAGAAVVCSTGLTKGAMGVSDEGYLSFCPGSGTTSMSIAWGTFTGDALTGDSATGFFSTGTIEDARIDGSAEADEINHDSLAGFVANEHVDHTAVSINTGGGLSGGGTIAATRTLAVDSTKEGFLADLGAGASVVCSTGLTKGAMGVSDEGYVSFCPGAGTTSMSLAWGNASGAALTGDSATAFFSTGTFADALIDGGLEADEIDVDQLASWGFWGVTATKETNDIIFNGVEADFEAGVNEGFPRLAQSTTPPATACNEAAESGRLYWDTDAATDGAIFACRGAAGWKQSGTSYTAGSGLAESPAGTLTTDSTEAAFLTDLDAALLVCSTGLTQGAASVTDAGPIQYCPGSGTSTVYTALGDSSGNANVALTGDSATGFFSTGTIEDARINGANESEEVVHDSTSGFVANEHVDHTGVSINAGGGLSGGGTIAATRTIAVDSTKEGFLADLGAGAAVVCSTGLTKGAMGVSDEGYLSFCPGAGTTSMSIAWGTLTGAALTGDSATAFFSTGTIEDARIDGSAEADEINHDSLAGFVANEHVDHTSVTLTAGAGLSGGGTIAANRSFAVDSTETDFLTNYNADTLLVCSTGITGGRMAISHTTGAGTIQYCADGYTSTLYLAQGDSTGMATTAGTALTGDSATSFFATGTIEDARINGANESEEVVHDSTNGFVANEHIDHTAVSITAGTGLTGGGTIAANRTLSVVADTTTQRVGVSRNSAADVGARPTINLIEGSNVTLTVADDAGGNEIDVTIAASGGTPVAGQGIAVSGSTVSLKYSDRTTGTPSLGARQCVFSDEQTTAAGSILCESTNADGTETLFSFPAYENDGNQWIVVHSGVSPILGVDGPGLAVSSDYLQVNLGTGLAYSGDNIRVDSVATGFLTDLDAALLVCSTGLTQGKAAVTDAGPIQYCPGSGTSTVYTALGDSSGNANVALSANVALTGDSATGFFSTGTIEDARINGANEADEINHDSLAGFVANEHINHTSVTLTAGSGLGGGGDISANRTFTTASTETDFLTSYNSQTILVCSTGLTGGQIAVSHTTENGTLQWCADGLTTTLYAALGDSTGRASKLYSTVAGGAVAADLDLGNNVTLDDIGSGDGLIVAWGSSTTGGAETALRLDHALTGTAGASHGTDILWRLENAAGGWEEPAIMRVRWGTDVAGGTEEADVVFYAMHEGSGGANNTWMHYDGDADSVWIQPPTTATATAQNVLRAVSNTSGTPARGFGAIFTLEGDNSGGSLTPIAALDGYWEDATAGTTDATVSLQAKDDNSFVDFFIATGDYFNVNFAPDLATSLSRAWTDQPGMEGVWTRWVHYTDTSPIYFSPVPSGPYVVDRCSLEVTEAWNSTTAAIEIGNTDQDGFATSTNVKVTGLTLWHTTADGAAQLDKYQTSTLPKIVLSVTGTPTAGKALVVCNYARVDVQP